MLEVVGSRLRRWLISFLIQGVLHWRVAVLDDSKQLVLSAFMVLWNYLKITALFLIWKLRCKFLFANEDSSVAAFHKISQEEVCN